MRNQEKAGVLALTLLFSTFFPLNSAFAHDHWGGPRPHPGPRWDHHREPPRGHQHFDHHNRPRPYARHEFYYGGHHFRPGGRYPHRYYQNRYWVNDWRHRGLYAPPAGHRWANVDGNYVLIAIASGVITSLILNH